MSTSSTTTTPLARWPACAPQADPGGIHRPAAGRALSPAGCRRAEAFALWEAARRSREEGYLAEARTSGERRDETDLAGGGYERVALAAMRALSGGGAAELILNTRNTVNTPGSAGGVAGPEAGGAGSGAQVVPAVPGLPADAVVEVPCRVTPDGAVPVPQDRPGPAQLELMRRVKDVERLVVEAATTGRREAALAAFARHPLVDSEVLAGKLLAGYEAAFPELGRSGTAA